MTELNIGVLISGRGSNMAAIADAASRGELDGKVSIVIANNPAADGIELARARRLQVEIVDRRDGRPRAERHHQILELLQKAETDLVVCAGFDEILTDEVTAAFQDRLLNIHPSLLPAFGGGMHATRDALEYGAKITGCTVHFVTSDLDNGPILIQRAVDVLEDDTDESLAARVLAQEHSALPQAINLIAAGRVTLEGRRVRIAPEQVTAAS